MLLEERVGQATTEAEAVRFALELYGLEVTAKALPGEYDDNFHLTTIKKTKSVSVAEVAQSSAFALDNLSPRFMNPALSVPGSLKPPLRDEGSAFVLKVMHPAREESLIDLQCRALQHLAQHA